MLVNVATFLLYIIYFYFLYVFYVFYHRVSSKNEIKQRAGGFVFWIKELLSFENLAHDTLNL